jgi:hypothetical protein
MPVYICQAGSSSSEPWRHGLQVYAAPFALNDIPVGGSNSARGGDGEGEEDDNNPNVTIAPPLVPSTRQEIDNNNNHNDHQQQQQREHHQEDEIRDGAATDAATSGGPIHNSTSTTSSRSQRDDDLLASIHSAKYGLPVRRIRHAEVVLVDDVCIAFDRHWLRLRWPGTKGGFAGYVALGKVDNNNNSNEPQLSLLNRNRVQTSSGNLLVLGMYTMVPLIIGVRLFVCVLYFIIFSTNDLFFYFSITTC